MPKYEKIGMTEINVEVIREKQKEKWWSDNQISKRLWINDHTYRKTLTRGTMKRKTIELLVKIFNEIKKTTIEELIKK